MLDNQTNPVVAFAADADYVMPLAAALASVISNLGRDAGLSVFIVDAGVSLAEKEKVSRLADGHRISIEWLSPPGMVEGLLKTLPSGYVGRNCYYKLLIPELLGAIHPRVIYLDSDVIVEADICELWNMDMRGNYALAAHDLINPSLGSPFGLKNWRQLGREPDEMLFNSGVLVLNSTRWIEDGIFSRLMAYLRYNRKYVQLCDQDALNAVFNGKWGKLDPSWNVLPYMKTASDYCLLNQADHEALIMNASILHFCGPRKPWTGRCSHPKKNRFFHYLDMTPWEGWRPKPWLIGRNTIVYYFRRVEGAVRRILS